MKISSWLRLSDKRGEHRAEARDFLVWSETGGLRYTERGFLLLFLLAFLLSSTLSAQTLDDARALQQAGRLEAAVHAYRVVANDPAADPATAAAARNGACAVLTTLGRYEAALAECRQALEIGRGLGDERVLAPALDNTGLALLYLGRPRDAEPHFRDALEINRKQGDAQGQVLNLAHLGQTATAQGNDRRALALHRQAAAIAAVHGEEPWAADRLRAARIQQGEVLQKLGAYRQALDLYRQALAAAEDPDPRRRAVLQTGLGVAYRNLGDPARALEAFQAAVDLHEEIGDAAALSNAWLELGTAHHLGLANPQAAEEAYRWALEHARKSGGPGEEIQALFYLGRLLLDLRRLDEAEQELRRCLELAERSGSPEGRWSALAGLGRVEAARGRTSQALEHLERAMTDIETVRATVPPGPPGFHSFGDKRPVYTAAVELLAGLEKREPGAGHAERALEIAQRAKIRELLDALRKARRSAQPLEAAALRERIGDGVLLEYLRGERNLYLWIIRRDGVRMADLGPADPIQKATAEVHETLSRGRKLDFARLAALSKALLGPVGQLPETAEGPIDLRIAPDGVLRYLPFELLEDPRHPGTPLVARAAVSYLPSAAVLAWLERDSGEPAVTLAGFGAPRLPEGDPTSPAALLVSQTGLRPLPGAEQDLRDIARRLGGRSELHLGGQATEEAFRWTMERGARFVHLATHIILDDRPGRGAAILLTPSKRNDGLLDPEEIAASDNRSGLTVLAVCLAVPGPVAESGALETLAGAFLAAGSPAVIASLWNVDDAATAALMDHLYDQLGQREEPAAALRLAKEKLRTDPRWSRPEHWAGYVLIGNGSGGASPFPRSLWPWVLGVLALGALGLGLWRLRASRTD